MKKFLLQILFVLPLVGFFLISFTTNNQTSAQSAPLVVYGILPQGSEALNPTWDSIAFGATTVWELNNPSPVYSGKVALMYTEKAPYQMLELRTTTPVPISNYKYLNFHVQASQPGRHYVVTLLAAGTASQPSKKIGKAIYFSPTVGTWTAFSIPLTDFAVGTTEVYGIGIQENDGGAQPPIYLDEIQFSNTTAANTPNTTPPPGGQAGSGPTATTLMSPQPSPTITPTPGPHKEYSPKISPWIFLIPGFIIFLLVLFH